MILTVGCHKGGVGKSTTAMMVALQLAQTAPTVVIDGDGQGSASTWQREAGDTWPEALEVVEWRDPLTLPPAWGGHVVIDTGPGDVPRLRSALEVSDTAIIPIGSRRGDIVQLRQTVDTVEEVANRRPLVWGALLTFVRLRTRAAARAVEAIERDDLPLLRSVVPLSEVIAESFGTVPTRFYAYADVYREITEEVTANA